MQLAQSVSLGAKPWLRQRHTHVAHRPLPHTQPSVLPAPRVKPGRLFPCNATLAAPVSPQAQIPFEKILRAVQNPSKQAALPDPPKEATFRHVIPYLIKLALDEKGLVLRAGGALMCLLASKAAGLACPLMIKKAVDSFTINASQSLPVILGAATQFLLLYGLCDVLKHVFKELQAPLFTPLSQAASRRIAYHTFAHVLGLDIGFHLDRRTGRLSRILERGTRSIQMLYRAVLFTFAPTALELVFVCGVLAKNFSPLVGGLVVASFTAYVTWSIILTQIAADARKQVNELDNAASAKAVDALLSYETVTLFNNQALEVEQYNVYMKQYMKATVTTDRLAALLNSGQAVILAIGLTAIMITALHTSGPSVTAGDLVMIQGLLLQLWAPLQFLGWFYRELRSALVDMEEFFAILRTDANIKDGTLTLPASPPPPTLHHTAPAAAAHHEEVTYYSRNGNGNGSASGNGRGGFVQHGGVLHPATQQASHSNGASREAVGSQASEAQVMVSEQQGGGLLVELQDIHFGYTSDRQILRGVSLQVQPGRSMALVGTSGSGKSTILRLLTRLYDVNGGSVLLNGCDVRDLTLQSLRAAVAVVPQETTLFNDTILQNIRYGRPEASDEEVIHAARMAHLDKAVERMPQGYATVVGERGLKLSGGEKQRVAIARAFLRQPRLLICDEATSALDSETEKQIMASLDELAQGRTSVFVAHRLSTVKNCDTIVVLSGGRVVEQGSHEELLSRPGGEYRRMWELQAREETDKKREADVTGAVRKSEAEDVESEELDDGVTSGGDSEAMRVVMSVSS